jgi:hypothetical protein
MYSLFVSGQADTWNGKPWNLKRGQVFREHTDGALAGKYGRLDDRAVTALKNFPAIFAYESVKNLAARVGWITRINVRDDIVHVEYEMEQDIRPIPPERLMRWGLDIAEYEMVRPHWALKEVELYPVLLDTKWIDYKFIERRASDRRFKKMVLDRPPAERDIQLPAFRKPKEPRENDLVSVMMPFDPGFDEVYMVIEQSCRQADLYCKRADRVWEEDEVIQEVYSLIYRSAIVVCDFSGLNPNVFYEAGIAHTLGRPVIPLSQIGTEVPFDIQHRRSLRYGNDENGLAMLSSKLIPRLQALRRRLAEERDTPS